MKKFGIIFAFVVLFAFGYTRANKDKPREIEIKKYSLGDNLEYGDLSLVAKNKVIKKENNTNNLVVTYLITNNSNEEKDAFKLIGSITFFYGLSHSIGQNFIPEKGMIPDDVDIFHYKYEYDDEDFILKARESKTFVIYYSCEDYNKESDFESSLVFDNNLYYEKYNKKLMDGIFYYEIIDFGEAL